MRILVVDDEPTVGKFIRKMLRGMGEIDSTDSGASALALHGNLRFDLILVDINLADATGPLLAVRLQAEFPTRIVLMSGNPELGGWDGDLLAKPFDEPTLRALVARTLTRPLGYRSPTPAEPEPTFPPFRLGKTPRPRGK